MSRKASLLARFERHVDRSGECWLWTASVGSHGYGQLSASLPDGRKTTLLAHRFAYEVANGLIAQGLQIDHLCRVRRCVRPDHLEAVTQRENILRSEAPCAVVHRTNRCSRGHELNEQSSYRTSRGWRVCRACAQIRWQRTAPRQREAAKARSRAWYWANKEKRSA